MTNKYGQTSSQRPLNQNLDRSVNSHELSIHNRKTVNKPYASLRPSNSFSQEKIIEKETLIKIEERLPKNFKSQGIKMY